MIPAIGSPPWTPEEDERLRKAGVDGHKCRRDGKADEAQHCSGPQPRRPVEESGGKVA